MHINARRETTQGVQDEAFDEVNLQSINFRHRKSQHTVGVSSKTFKTLTMVFVATPNQQICGELIMNKMRQTGGSWQ